MSAWRSPGIWLILLAVLATSLWPVFTQRAATREVLFTVLLSVALASSLNIILGYTGYVSFGHIVFFGLGGYVGLYLMSALACPLPCAAAGGLSAALLAFCWKSYPQAA
jgi:branched-chain amino acid transport system permease protein